MRIDAAIDVLQRNPFRGLHSIEHLNSHGRSLEYCHGAGHELTHQGEDLGQTILARHLEAPAALEQLGVHGRLLGCRERLHGLQRTTGLFKQAQLTALVVTKLLRIIFRRPSHGQALGLCPEGSYPPGIEIRNITHALAHRYLGVSRYRKDDFGIAHVQQVTLAFALEDLLGQGHMPPPARHSGH
ncbi:hypothetical protein D3C81_1529920 [compost metagenome]